jgi:putative transposase
MDASFATSKCENHRLSVEIISHVVWLYVRFCLSCRDVEEPLCERGVSETSETMRNWCRNFGQTYVNQLRRRRPRPSDKWQKDAVLLTIKAERYDLWRAAQPQPPERNTK